MNEFLKTLLMLNIQGSVLVVLLLLLRKLIQKSFSGKWQRNIWIFVAIIFLFPAWKLVPEPAAPSMIIPFDNTFEAEYEVSGNESHEDNNAADYNIEVAPVKNPVNYEQLATGIYAVGVLLFFAMSFMSYMVYLIKAKKSSITYDKENLFEETKAELGIERRIKIRRIKNIESPALTGCFFPVVYMPDAAIPEDEERLVYIHELTHYKHKDLPLKWFVCVINAINWFNPFIYLVMKNINEACEIYCDEAVTRTMDDEGKNAYMNTILNLVAKK